MKYSINIIIIVIIVIQLKQSAMVVIQELSTLNMVALPFFQKLWSGRCLA